MRIIARNKLVAFWEKHPETEAALKHWYEVTAGASWQTPLEALAEFPKAKVLNGERLRFEIAGGNYRLIAAFDWRRGIVFIKFIGTHTAYDRIDALTVNLF